MLLLLSLTLFSASPAFSSSIEAGWFFETFPGKQGESSSKGTLCNKLETIVLKARCCMADGATIVHDSEDTYTVYSNLWYVVPFFES